MRRRSRSSRWEAVVGKGRPGTVRRRVSVLLLHLLLLLLRRGIVLVGSRRALLHRGREMGEEVVGLQRGRGRGVLVRLAAKLSKQRFEAGARLLPVGVAAVVAALGRHGDDGTGA